LTLKIYTKGERVLRIEVVVHNTQELQCGRSLEKFPQIVVQAKEILERFMNALSCIDQCFIADSMLDELPTPSRVGTTKVGGIDLNKPRMRWVVEAVIALCLSLSPQGFTASELARQVRMLSNQAEGQYDARRAAYDLKKLRGKKIVHRIDQTRRYQSTSSAREPARIMIAIGSEDRWHLQLAQRWIIQYNFYINDQRWGRMFVRMSPYLPFSARVCLNQHHWLAKRLMSERVRQEPKDTAQPPLNLTGARQ
jgi:hypothetical protein